MAVVASPSTSSPVAFAAQDVVAVAAGHASTGSRPPAPIANENSGACAAAPTAGRSTCGPISLRWAYGNVLPRLVGEREVRRPRDREAAALGAEHDVLEPEPAAVGGAQVARCRTTTR